MDLAIQLRMRLGDWFQVQKLVAERGAGDDDTMRMVHRALGKYQEDRGRLAQAASHYRSAGSYEVCTFHRLAASLADASLQEMVAVQIRKGDHTGLASLVLDLPDASPLLAKIGEHFMDVGMCSDAVTAFLRAGGQGNVKRAIDACIMLGDWRHGIELAERFRMPQVEGVFARHASALLQRRDIAAKMDAIQLYLRAGKATEAAALLGDMAIEQLGTKVRPGAGRNRWRLMKPVNP